MKVGEKKMRLSVAVCNCIRNVCIFFTVCRSFLLHQLYGTRSVSNCMHVGHVYHNRNWYKIPVLHKRGPKSFVFRIYDEKDHDVTKNILPFFGPNVDIYGMKIKPKDLGLKEMKIFCDLEDEPLIFKANDVIKLT